MIFETSGKHSQQSRVPPQGVNLHTCRTFLAQSCSGTPSDPRKVRVNYRVSRVQLAEYSQGSWQPLQNILTVTMLR